jgi:hypothetical protein
VLTGLLRGLVMPRRHGLSSDRLLLARLLDDVVDAALGHRPARCRSCLLRSDVARACACSAASVADALRDPETTVDWMLVIELREFLTDGYESPLFGDAPEDASCALRQLEQRLQRHGGDAP